MALKDAKDLDPASSAETDEILDVADAGSEETIVTNASSSDAKGEVAEKDTPNIVREVVEERGEKTATAASPAAGEETGEVAGDKSTKAKEPDDVNYSDVPFHKHPRFQQVIRRLKTAETDAGRYQNVQKFLDDHGLPSNEAANALTIFAKAKVDPQAAWAEIKPWVQSLLVAAGEVVPADLEARVTSGELSREAALEIGRHRAKAESVVKGQEFTAKQAEARTQTELGQRLVSTAADWETDRQAKDPNFGAKIVPLQKEIAYLHQQEGKPNTPEGVLDQLKRAYKAVNDLAQFKPAPPAVRKPAIRPVTGGQVAQNIQPKSRTTMDIIRSNRRSA